MTAEEAAALEALLDPRLGDAVVPAELAERVAGGTTADLAAFRSERPIEWATRTVQQASEGVGGEQWRLARVRWLSGGRPLSRV